jgi:hypothetical protein
VVVDALKKSQNLIDSRVHSKISTHPHNKSDEKQGARENHNHSGQAIKVVSMDMQ